MASFANLAREARSRADDERIKDPRFLLHDAGELRCGTLHVRLAEPRRVESSRFDRGGETVVVAWWIVSDPPQVKRAKRERPTDNDSASCHEAARDWDEGQSDRRRAGRRAPQPI